MSNNAGSCQVVKFQPIAEVSEDLQNFAEDFFEVVSNDYTDDGLEQLVGYLRNSVSEQDMLYAAQNFGIKLPEYTIEKLQSDDWLADNVIKFAPLEVAEFLVYGIHEKNIDTNGKIGVRVYAATAFGSEHQTTKCCLQAISDINKTTGCAERILDVGTGSGILSIAAAKIWKNSEIVAVDIDDESVEVAKQNALDNGVEKQIKVTYSDGYSSKTVQENAPYDVILANILARPLIAMASDMANNLKIGGYAVISGFIDEQVDWVVGEHQKYGLELQKVYKMDNWRAALLKRIK
ncbi:MAG: 50S ribosomal protein L11 methyltransferase [Alphaproteobacteria bacterium]|nr:50S ribosomal protein L11 methyltransferase [Alphaproteobacteria bacterium]